MAKLFILMLFLFCILQNAHSQFLNPSDKKEEYLPPHTLSASIIEPNVEKWMNEQLIQIGKKRTVEMKWDAMGRVKSNTDKAEKEEVNITESKQKRLVIISDRHIEKHEIEPKYGRYEYNAETRKHDHFLNGKKISEKEYIEHLDKSLEEFKRQKSGKRDLPIPSTIAADAHSWMAWMTAEEISELVKNYKELVIEDYTELKPLASQAAILSFTQLSTHAFSNNYRGNGVGVYVLEPKNAILSGITNLNKYTAVNTGWSQVVDTSNAHHTMVANVVQMSSPLAHVFGFARTPLGGGVIYNPDNPFSYSPPLEIGSHSYYNDNNDEYKSSSMFMDNYIYEYGVINFVAAGNGAEYGEVVTSPSKAMNAITVGAVTLSPILRYASYSNWKNPVLVNRNANSEQRMGSDKPEIAMYTDIEFPNNSVMQTYYPNHTNGFNGTSAATPLAAGFAATLLSQHPFFKRQPALMKAVFLTGETMPIRGASSWDLDNGSNDYGGYNAPVVAREVIDYSSVAWGTRSAWWNGGNSDFFDSNNEIKFTENNIQANKHYRIAIAYLVEGNYIHDNGKLPQDIDLQILQNGKVIAYSQSGRNPFEVVDFVTASNAPLTISIYRISNSGSGNVLLGYHMRENL